MSSKIDSFNFVDSFETLKQQKLGAAKMWLCCYPPNQKLLGSNSTSTSER